MVTRVRFFADWAEFPLWPDEERDGIDLARDESLPEDLIERLCAWCDEFEKHAVLEPGPHSPPAPRRWWKDFDRRGRALAEEVAEHLGPGYVVEYRP